MARATSALWVLGDGGLAREVEALAAALPGAGERWTAISRVDVAAEQTAAREGGDAVLGMGSPTIRAAVTAARADAFAWPALVHPTANVGPRVDLGRGVVLGANVVITVDARVAEFTMLNLAVTVGHDARIGRCCIVNPGVAISGGVTLGDECLVGAGAVVLEGIRIGAGATIAAGAVVVKDVAPGETVVGVPARPLQKSTTEESS